MKDKNCRLCKLERITPWFYETENWVVIECDTCKVPMYVHRFHEEPSKQIVDEMVKDAGQRFPNKMIDMRRKKIPEHMHFHMRN